MTLTFSFHDFSDRELLTEVTRLVASERDATARLVASLAEVDARRLYLSEGCSSLFTYCTQVLHLSEHAAYNRIEAARAARRFPRIFERLGDGSIHLTAVRLLAPILTMENHQALLDAARHKSKRDIEHLLAQLNPEPEAAPSIRKLPAPTASLLIAEVPPVVERPKEAASSPRELASPAAAQRPVVRPVSPERYKVQFTVSQETGSRHIPAAVKRDVWTRDGGQCAFVGSNGRCTETGFLEFHHITPYADGGETSVNNLELRCRPHNAYEAEKYFGAEGPLFVRERPNHERPGSSSFRNELLLTAGLTSKREANIPDQ